MIRLLLRACKFAPETALVARQAIANRKKAFKPTTKVRKGHEFDAKPVSSIPVTTQMEVHNSVHTHYHNVKQNEIPCNLTHTMKLLSFLRAELGSDALPVDESAIDIGKEGRKCFIGDLQLTIDHRLLSDLYR